jgi:hypothetical protein
MQKRSLSLAFAGCVSLVLAIMAQSLVAQRVNPPFVIDPEDFRSCMREGREIMAKMDAMDEHMKANKITLLLGDATVIINSLSKFFRGCKMAQTTVEENKDDFRLSRDCIAHARKLLQRMRLFQQNGALDANLRIPEEMDNFRILWTNARKQCSRSGGL